MSTFSNLAVGQRGFGETSRRDGWWIQPLLVFLGLSVFLVYANWAAFQGEHYTYGTYLSPFYSPEIFGDSPHSWFGPKPAFWPGFLPFSPALLILWAPAGFRFTCYYYRGAYYKAFWADPPSARSASRESVLRRELVSADPPERSPVFPLFRAALPRVPRATTPGRRLWFTDAASGAEVVRHRRRHAGAHDERRFPRRVHIGLPLASGTWSAEASTSYREPRCAEGPTTASSCLNQRHMMWAWMSLFWVAFSDLYVRLCSMGIWSDWRIL